ncbi:hypothetical protein V500_04682, partial [Pseudogymnoascus sp. VKM F-4518 (FW-2643)]
ETPPRIPTPTPTFLTRSQVINLHRQGAALAPSFNAVMIAIYFLAVLALASIAAAASILRLKILPTLPPNGKQRNLAPRPLAMTNLSRSEAIRCKPIGDGLNVFRDSFKSLCEDRGVSTSVDGLQHIGPEGTDDFDIERVTPLLKAVIKNESDDIIWDEAYAAVTESTPLPFLNQPPWSNAASSIVNSSAAFDTPLRSSSASQRGIEQTHDEVDHRILEELAGRVYYDVAITCALYKNWRHVRWERRKEQSITGYWGGATNRTEYG